MRAASDRIVPVSFELGGKSPSIVFPDANEDWVVDGIIAAMRFHAAEPVLHRGLPSLPPSRHLRQLSRCIGEEGEERSKLGNPLDEASDIGTIINEAVPQSVRLCRRSASSGARRVS